MRLSHIEHILDSVDPYFLTKDLNFDFLDRSTIEELENVDQRTVTNQQKLFIEEFSQFLNQNKSKNGQNDFLACKINNRYIRILPFGYLNVDFLKNLDEETFISGSVIDFLAFYMGNDYDKAFKLFFQQYSSLLKNKLAQEPAFIEKVIKGSYIKRHNILNYIVKRLYNSNLDNHNLVQCKQWANRHQIENFAGYAYFDTTQNIYNMLMFFEKSISYDYFGNTKDKLVEKSEYSDFINKHLLKDSNQWVVVPYFSDFHIVSGLKFINPTDDTFYFLKLNDAKLSYAGIYALTPSINFNDTKVRILEADTIALASLSYAKKMMNQDNLFYLVVHIDQTGVASKSNIATLAKPLFLYEPNSSLPLMKSLYDSLLNKQAMMCDLYVCKYNNFREDNTAYTFEAFLEKQFKDLVKNTCINEQGQASLSKELTYFINCCDFNNRKFKQKVVKWLLASNYRGLYQQILELNEEVYEYKNYLIKPTTNGYIASSKSNGLSIKSSDIAITNFILKIDQVILFQNVDDILYKGRLIMGTDVEFPVSFYKKELSKGNAVDALEKIALKAFSSSSLGTDIAFTIENYTLPTVLDSSFGNILINLIKREITKAPCSYGVLEPGWDKSNGIFNTPSFQITAYRQTFRPQSIYSLTMPASNKNVSVLIRDIQNCFTTLPIDYVNYSADLSFLNKEIKDLISGLLAILYRTYLGYEVKPFYILDSVNARNLVKFIFSVFGQIKPLELPANQRLLKNNGEAIFDILNNYPLYARCPSNADIIVDKIKDYPLFFFLKTTDVDNLDNIEADNNIFSVNETVMNAETYKQVASFTQDTLLRFFKWLFKVQTEQFELTDQSCNSQEQLIEEGNLIFSYLWWDDVIEECDKDVTPEAALKGMITVMTAREVRDHINYYPEKQCYVLKRFWLSEQARKATVVAYRVLKGAGKAWKDTTDSLYIFLDKEFFEETTKNVFTKNMKPVTITKVFVSPALAVTTTKYGSHRRTLRKKELIRRVNNNMPGYDLETLKISI